MSSYHSSFTYLNQNSAIDHHLRIASFEPDSGAVDTFLSMEAISEDSYDGTKKFDYGARYNSVAEINITFIKPDGSDFSVADNRRLLKWLTGSRTNSWLDLYEGDKVKYSFFGRITNIQQQKMDARVIGLIATFTSIHPWAWSPVQTFDCEIGENSIAINGDGAIYKYSENESFLGVDENGILFNDDDNITASFYIDHFGVIYNDEDVAIVIDNGSDDLYTYIYLDMVYTNIDGNEKENTLTIKNETLNEDTIISNISRNEVVSLSSGQFIISDKENKIFGDAFNFVWPRLSPGVNNFKINGSGKAHIKFTFRYPIKIGDCAVDIENIINNPVGCDYISNGGSGVNIKNVILYTEQTLTDEEKAQARTNIGALSVNDLPANIDKAVLCVEQNLEDNMQQQVRTNIGAISADDIPESIKNPYSLKLTGAVDVTYDGSTEVVVDIPENEPVIASKNTLGMVKVGNGLSITSDGVLNATSSGSSSTAPVFSSDDEGEFIIVDAEGNMISARGYIASIEADSIAKEAANEAVNNAVNAAADKAAYAYADPIADDAADDAVDAAKEQTAADFWIGKKSIWFGTSITAYCAQSFTIDGTTHNLQGYGYTDVVTDTLGMIDPVVKGYPGVALAHSDNDFKYGNNGPICDYIASSSLSSYDLVSIESATNDYKLNVPLGSWSNSSSFNTNTFYGALQYSIEDIYSKNPNAVILIIADTHRDNDDHDSETANSAKDKGDSQNRYLEDYVDAMDTTVTNYKNKGYNIVFCDWYNDSGITLDNVFDYTFDGLHLDKDGYNKVGLLTESTLSSYAFEYADQQNYDIVYNTEYNRVRTDEYNAVIAEKRAEAQAQAQAGKYDFEYNSAYQAAYGDAFDSAYDSISAPTYIDVKNNLDGINTNISNIQIDNTNIKNRLSTLETELNGLSELLDIINGEVR